MTFLETVNRVLRSSGIIRGDTDPVTSFSDLQHGATLNLAIIAIQDELNELISDNAIPYEHDNTGSIVTVASTRSYSLPTNFVRFAGTPSLYDSASNVRVYEFPGGEDALRDLDYKYLTNVSNPIYFYFDATTTKKIAFWPIPQEANTYTFDYQKSVSVSAASDTMPFHTDAEGQAFARLATRRFKMLFEGLDSATIPGDPERNSAKATLFSLMSGGNPSRSWAPVYR